MRRPDEQGEHTSDTLVESLVESLVEENGVREGDRIGGRYQVAHELGRGGMAVVYRAKDIASGRPVAVKQLVLSKENKHYGESVVLFENEFHTLAQLSHPTIIEVYDYGVDEAGPYYTMELLDGGDLRELSPLPWQKACTLLHGVSSSLALLHSRRLVHRDVSPRNVRCTHDGNAKLIDFGAMVPMGPGGLVVGTPAFVAPEVLHRSRLDARTDLFSLGATLYYALTRHLPYRARDLSQLFEAWLLKPEPPSRYVEGIPEALDALVLSLLSMDPASRPRTAFDVMQRLAAIAGIERAEPLEVARGYLSTPVMLGRDDILAILRREMTRSFEGRGRGVLIQGSAGLGHSRMLDACALVVKTLGGTVLRATGSAVAGQGFVVAQMLAAQLVEALPDTAPSIARSVSGFEALFSAAERQDESDGPVSPPAGRRPQTRPVLKDLTAGSVNRFETQTALCRWFLRTSDARPLAILVDDVHRIDEPSAALLAALASQADRHALIVVATAESGAEPTDRIAFDVLARRSSRLTLTPLSRAETEHLFVSVFGDVPNVGALSDGVYKVAAGNPRATMDLAQHLVDTGRIKYDGGVWTLPAHPDEAGLPQSVEDAVAARLETLSPTARWLAGAHALASHQAFTLEQYRELLPGTDVRAIDAAITELVSQQVLVSDGRVYTVAHRGWGSALTTSLDKNDAVARHTALAGIYKGSFTIAAVRHLLLARLEERALDLIATMIVGVEQAADLFDESLSVHDVAATFEKALDAAVQLGRSGRQINELRRWLVSLSVSSEDAFYWRTAPDWLEQLKRDSGFYFWQKHADEREPGARLSRAMQLAFAQYMETPEPERVYRPDEAIRGLVQYVGASIAIGSRTLDAALTETLPAVLEPFAPISPLVDAIWQNAKAARESLCRLRPERASAIWRELYDRLGNLTGADLRYLDVIRHAVAFGLGSSEAWMGIESATQWADRLDDDPLQQVSAVHLRRIVRLQQGDWEGAERLRRQAEVLGLQARSRQMFTNLISVELIVHTLARDLTAMRQSRDRIDTLAARSPGWVPYARLARGRFELVRNNFEKALDEFSGALETVTPGREQPYPLNVTFLPSLAGKIEALTGLGRCEEARALGEEALETCRTLEIRTPAYELSRAVAIAEAKLGNYAGAAARLETVARDQAERGITGLFLGVTYEARARIAIWAGDDKAVEEYSRLTAREYRHGRGSPLAARYEQLMDEARQGGKDALPQLSEFDSRLASPSTLFSRASATAMVTQALRGAETNGERAERALTLIVDMFTATDAYLFLFTDDELRLAACHGASTPPRGLGKFVKDFLDRCFSNPKRKPG